MGNKINKMNKLKKTYIKIQNKTTIGKIYIYILKEKKKKKKKKKKKREEKRKKENISSAENRTRDISLPLRQVRTYDELADY